MPDWEIPPLYGYAAAIESMGSGAAPFLAGLSIALATLVLSAQDSFGQADLALFLLVAATLALLGAVQCTFWGRCYLVTPAELTEWWGRALDDPDRTEKVEEEQRIATAEHSRWSGRASWFYDCGLSLLLLAVPILLIPKGGLGQATNMRLAVFALALLGFALEAMWIAGSQKGLVKSWKRRLGL